MRTPSEVSRLCGREGERAALHSVQIHLDVLGLLLRLRVRQTWHNPLAHAWSGRWHFPLGAEQTLLAMTSDSGQIIQVQRDSRTMCSAMIDLPACEQVTLQWRCAQLLSLQGGSLRIELPAGLAPAAQQALQLQVELNEPLASGTVSTPHPAWQRARHRQGMTLGLFSAQGLTQNVSLAVHGLRAQGFAIASPDLAAPGQCSVLLSHTPTLRRDAREHSALRIKLLIDQSSAMPAPQWFAIGDALEHLLASLGPADQCAYSHFGMRTVHELPRLQTVTEAYLRRLRALLRRMAPGAGETQPEAAIEAVLGLPDENEEPVRDADIVLVSARPLWRLTPLQHALRQQGHRLHVLAVGQAAAQSLWHELAQASGGRCESLVFGQSAQQALARLFLHLRSQFPVRAEPQLEGGQLLSPSVLSLLWADGQTQHVWAQVQAETAWPTDPKLHATLHWKRADDRPGGTPSPGGALSPSPLLWDAQADLARLHAAHVHGHDESAAHMPGLALPPVSLPPPTDGQPPPSECAPPPPATPDLVNPAAAALPTLAAAPLRASALPLAHAPRTATIARPQAALVRQGDLAHWLSHASAPGNPVTALVHGFNTHAEAYGTFRAALVSTLHTVPTRFLDSLVLQLSQAAGNPARVWALLLYWLHAEHAMDLSPAALKLVAQELADMPVTQRQQMSQAFTTAATCAIPRAAA